MQEKRKGECVCVLGGGGGAPLQRGDQFASKIARAHALVPFMSSNISDYILPYSYCPHPVLTWKLLLQEVL